jgi:hypothetical protein
VTGLKSGTVDHLVVDNQLATTVVDDQSTNAASSILVGVANALEETALTDHRQTLLDITSLGHSDDPAVVADIQDAVGLVHRTEHGLDHHRRRGVGHEARLLVELASEQVHPEEAVLARLGRDGDADHLARTALEDEQVANTDEVDGDWDGRGRAAAATRLNDPNILSHALPDAGRTFGNDTLLSVVMVGEGVEQAVSRTLDTAAERVVLTLVVVVTHLAVGSFLTDSFLGDADFGGWVTVFLCLDVDLADVVRVGTVGLGGGLVATVVGDVDFVPGVDPTTVLTLSNVKLGPKNLVFHGATLFKATNRFSIADGEGQFINAAERS